MLLWANVRARYGMMMNEGFGESQESAIMRGQQGLEGLHTPRPHGLPKLPTWKLSAWHGLTKEMNEPLAGS